MSPELKMVHFGKGFGSFNPEKTDIFSLGLSFLRVILMIYEMYIVGMNDFKNG